MRYGRRNCAWARALAILTMLATIGGPVFGEERDKAAATKPVKLRSFAVRHPLPFKLNEKLVYDVKFSRFPISANVGELTFVVDDVPGSDSHLKFVVTAVSRYAPSSSVSGSGCMTLRAMGIAYQNTTAKTAAPRAVSAPTVGP